MSKFKNIHLPTRSIPVIVVILYVVAAINILIMTQSVNALILPNETLARFDDAVMKFHQLVSKQFYTADSSDIQAVLDLQKRVDDKYYTLVNIIENSTQLELKREFPAVRGIHADLQYVIAQYLVFKQDKLLLDSLHVAMRGLLDKANYRNMGNDAAHSASFLLEFSVAMHCVHNAGWQYYDNYIINGAAADYAATRELLAGAIDQMSKIKPHTVADNNVKSDELRDLRGALDALIEIDALNVKWSSNVSYLQDKVLDLLHRSSQRYYQMLGLTQAKTNKCMLSLQITVIVLLLLSGTLIWVLGGFVYKLERLQELRSKLIAAQMSNNEKRG